MQFETKPTAFVPYGHTTRMLILMIGTVRRSFRFFPRWSHWVENPCRSVCWEISSGQKPKVTRRCRILNLIVQLHRTIWQRRCSSWLVRTAELWRECIHATHEDVMRLVEAGLRIDPASEKLCMQAIMHCWMRVIPRMPCVSIIAGFG